MGAQVGLGSQTAIWRRKVSNLAWLGASISDCNGSKGDGKSFVRNPRSDDMLATLATELVKAGKDN